ncbi:protein kinase [Nocardia fusca]|uniref:protein kinase domain-containing protein n=1 Tax=Nocardia fusca TaxID=941183 RepID=UPI00379FC014
MVERDPLRTQRDRDGDGDGDVVAELNAAGFADAVEIGRGGFGRVYRCTQVVVARTVAVKVLTGSLDVDRARFVREQRAMGRLTGHPNIVDMLEIGTTAADRPYLVMPYYANGSLETLIRHDGPLPLQRVLRLGVKIAGALETAHRLDTFHRDVKPSNILLTDYDEPALTDFGIAHIPGGFETSTGTMTGSPAFTAPEILSGATPSRAADVYGLGATLFSALTGHAAFERRSGEQMVAQFLRITEQPIPDLREHGIPDNVCAVIESAMSREPSARVSAKALGEQLQQLQRLYGLKVDEMALQTAPGASEEAPSAVTPTAIRKPAGNLPLELTSFISRRIQVKEVKYHLANSRLVTLTGIGGVGKSRLALRVGHKVTQDFPDGVWLIELGDLHDATLLADVVAATLGLRNLNAGTTLDIVVRHLSTRNLLLVLDNCEHLIDDATNLTEALLRACPAVRILATSRESLGIAGEAVYAVPPLSFSDPTDKSPPRQAHEDAVTLFVDRGAALVPGFEVSDINRDSVTRICARLDGLPLAIELAAARLLTLSPEQILSRLDDRFALLTRGKRDAPKRQQTLQWCIGWSYDLCTSTEKQLWNQLSAFVGGFELDTARQICGPDLTEQELLDALSALVDKSILIRDGIAGTVRFQMLETVREYGIQRAEEDDEYPELSRRHLSCCEHLALQAESYKIGSNQLQWVARLERELPNLRKAMDFSLSEGGDGTLRITTALCLFWITRGRLGEGRHWYERALGQARNVHPTDRAGALYEASIMAAIQFDLPAASDLMSQLETLAEATGDPLVKALLAHAEGTNCVAGGGSDLSHASTLLTEAVNTYDKYGEIRRGIDARISLGWAYALQGDTERALQHLQTALTTSESSGEQLLRSWALWTNGYVRWRCNELDRATQLLRDGIQSSRLATDPLLAAVCTETLAWILCEQRRYRHAALLMGAADALGRVAGSSAFMFRDLLVYREECELKSREALGTRVFESARNEGAAMSFDTTIIFALGEGSEAAAPAAHTAGQLTKREREVAELVARGMTNKAIAARLVISQRTAKAHIEHILTKLGFTSRSQIAVWVTEQPEP